MKKELSMENRLLIAFLLMGLVLLVSQYFMKPATPPPSQAKAQDGKAQDGKAKSGDGKKEDAAAAATPPPASAAQATAVPGQVQAEAEESVVIENKVARVTFSNRGAVVRSWLLKDYKDHSGKPLELVNTRALATVAQPFSLVFKNQQLPSDPNVALFKVEKDANNLGATFEYSDGRASYKKTFKFAPESYLAEVTSDVSTNGVRVPHSLVWRGGFGDETVQTAAADQHTLHYDLSNSKLIQTQVKEAKDAPLAVSGNFSFAGITDHYFAGVFLPAAKQSVEITTYSDQIPDAAGANQARIGAAVGGDGLNRFTFFAGPKDADLLKIVDPKLEQLIDWGTWFGFIAKPLFAVLHWTSDHMTHNYGWAIILVTILINLVLFPLRFTSLKSSKKMQALQPQIAAINEKYKNLPLKDPRKTEQNQEMMALYQKNGVNPVGGCLPMVLQLPFLIAFYTVLSVSIEMRGAEWLWVKDLSQHEIYYILPVLLVVTQFISQKMTPSPGMDPAQQRMMLVMPLVFGWMFYQQAAGLVLYWLTGNLVGIAQQWILNQTMPTQAVVASGNQKRK